MFIPWIGMQNPPSNKEFRRTIKQKQIISIKLKQQIEEFNEHNKFRKTDCNRTKWAKASKRIETWRVQAKRYGSIQQQEKSVNHAFLKSEWYKESSDDKNQVWVVKAR